MKKDEKKYNNYLHSIYILLDFKSILEMIESIQEGVYRLYENTTPFYIRDLSILRFQYSFGGPGTNSLQIWRDDCMCGGGLYTYSAYVCVSVCVFVWIMLLFMKEE